MSKWIRKYFQTPAGQTLFDCLRAHEAGHGIILEETFKKEFEKQQKERKENMKKYQVEFYRVVSVVKTIEAENLDELEKKAKKLAKGNVMKSIPTKISDTEWEVIDHE